MGLVKCPRCELNYIQEGEKYCPVCFREMKGEQIKEDLELCSVCNAAPALPGKDVCLSCHKEMLTGGGEDASSEATVVDENAMALNSVSSMDEIVPQIHEDIAADEFEGMEEELSLESVIEEEQNDEDEQDDM